MINCQQVVDFCFDFIEGDLPNEEQAAFRRHLGHCHACVNFFETYRRTPEISREVLKTQIPPSVKESVLAFLRTRRLTPAEGNAEGSPEGRMDGKADESRGAEPGASDRRGKQDR